MPELCNTGDHAGRSFSSTQVSEIIESQRAHFESGATRPIKFRLDALKKLLRGLEEREDPFLEALATDLGKPATEAWLAEVYFLRSELRTMIRKLGSWAKPRRVGHPIFLLPAKSEVRRESFGLSLIMAPWNYPLQLALSPAIGSIAAGNCVVIKPSEAAPATARVLKELIESTFRDDHVTVIEGGAETGAELLKHRFDHYFFTGGEKVGRLVAEAAARELAPCVLELGGKSPAIIDWSCDLDLAVDRLVAAKFFNAGQTCMAPDFVAVPDFRLHEFTAKLGDAIDRFYGSEHRELARVPNQDHWDRVMKLIPEHARQIGDDDPDSLLLAPRWAVVDWEHPSMKEEIFGPFLPILPYPDREEFLQQLRQLPSPLALYLFSDSEGFIERMMDEFQSGSVCINDAMKQAINLDLPFGGIGPSGHGRYRGRTSFETFTWERSITRRFKLDPFAARPPYGDLLEKLRKTLR